MDDNVTQLPTNDERIDAAIADMIGPERTGHTLIVDGRAVPMVSVRPNGDWVTFVLDNRLGFDFPKAQAIAAAHMLANALAIGAGYPGIRYCDTKKGFASRIGPLPPEMLG